MSSDPQKPPPSQGLPSLEDLASGEVSPPPALSPQPAPLATQLTFYAVYYVAFLVLMTGAFLLFREYLKPLVALVFPINENTSLLKNIVVLTVMYWGIIGIKLTLARRKPTP